MKETIVIVIAIVTFSIGYIVGSADARVHVKENLIADCTVIGTFRIDQNAYKCVKITGPRDETK